MKAELRVLLLIPLVLAAQNPLEEDRSLIVAAYQRSIDALNRGDADEALALETPDWVSITVGQKPVTRQEMEPLIRRDIASMKQTPDWVVVWKPDYEQSGTLTGIQIYDLKVNGDGAVVLCLVGSTQTETQNGQTHRVWRGSHVRDTWIRTSAGWKRRMHEKLTVNERMVDQTELIQGGANFQAVMPESLRLAPRPHAFILSANAVFRQLSILECFLWLTWLARTWRLPAVCTTVAACASGARG